MNIFFESSKLVIEDLKLLLDKLDNEKDRFYVNEAILQIIHLEKVILDRGLAKPQKSKRVVN